MPFAINHAHECHILPTGEATLETALDTDGPGNRAIALDAAAIRHIYAAQQLQQSGFSRPVGTDDGNRLITFDFKTQIIQDTLSLAFVEVALGERVDTYHWPNGESALSNC